MKKKPRTIGELTTGTRLLYRSRENWRFAAVSRIDGEKVTLIVCSPTGRTYRLRRKTNAEIVFDGRIPILKIDLEEDWRDNFSVYDNRW